MNALDPAEAHPRCHAAVVLARPSRDSLWSAEERHARKQENSQYIVLRTRLQLGARPETEDCRRCLVRLATFVGPSSLATSPAVVCKYSLLGPFFRAPSAVAGCHVHWLRSASHCLREPTVRMSMVLYLVQYNIIQ